MRLNKIFFNKIGKMLDFYSQFNPSPLSIKQFMDFGEYLQKFINKYDNNTKVVRNESTLKITK